MRLLFAFSGTESCRDIPLSSSLFMQWRLWAVGVVGFCLLQLVLFGYLQLDRPEEGRTLATDCLEVSSGRHSAVVDQPSPHDEPIWYSPWKVANFDTGQRQHGDGWGKTQDGEFVLSLVPHKAAEEETVGEKEKAHNPNRFNLLRSNSIPVSRDMASAVPPKCEKALYHEGRMVNTSVIFISYKEPLSTLLRSVHSVLNTSPPSLLHEIVIVDDGSPPSDDQGFLSSYITNHLPSKVHLLRLDERQGLMRARTAGARLATGHTLTFFDSHIECTPGWLEPLMSRIGEDRRHVVMPMINSINADTFEMGGNGLSTLGFDWNLHQIGIQRKAVSEYGPIASPAMAGGLFAIERELF